MTKMVYFLPMTRPHRLSILAYEGCQLLDVTGPAAVFGAANDAVGRKVCDLQIVSPDGGAVATNSGVALHSRRMGGQPETLLIAGGSLGLKALIARTDARRWVRRVAPRTARYGSVCTGAFALAAWGLLDGKRVATHWASCARLAERYPTLNVDPEQLYVVDGKVWTSAGVTTGVDMALALVEADLGAAVANLIARHFVLYGRRPGYQSQFSPLLQAQTAAEAPFAADQLDAEQSRAAARCAGTGAPGRRVGAQLLPQIHRRHGQDAGAFRRKPAPRRGAHAARHGPAAQGHCREGGFELLGAAGPRLRAPLRHGAVLVPRDARREITGAA